MGKIFHECSRNQYVEADFTFLKILNYADNNSFSDLFSVYLKTIEPRHEISNNVVCATSKGSDQPAHTRSLIRAFACRLNIL